MTEFLAGVLVGVLAGAALAAALMWFRRGHERSLVAALVERADRQRAAELEGVLERLRGVFGELAQHTLARSSEQFLQLADTRLNTQTQQHDAALDARRQVMDESLKAIAAKLAEVGQTLQRVEQDRGKSQGAINERLDAAAKVIGELRSATAGLREALSSSKRRGQWGERMADDVLRMAGFVEGVNYEKQAQTESGSRPDFTFPLPNGKRVHMDVKFPLENYLRFVDAVDAAAAEQAQAAFLKDARVLVRQLGSRDYIDPERGTVDYVLLFIPNEQIFSFLHEHDRDLIDDALRQRVVLCSPLTLYALLAVVRQTAENLRVEQASREILELLAAFHAEWGKFSETIDAVGKSLDKAREAYETLATTRTRKLEKHLARIEEIRRDGGV